MIHCFIVYLDLGYDGVIIDSDTRVFLNRRIAEEYRANKQSTEKFHTWKVEELELAK